MPPLTSTPIFVYGTRSAVEGACGAFAGRTWLARRGPATAALLSALYVGGFGASHPLAKRIGAGRARCRGDLRRCRVRPE